MVKSKSVFYPQHLVQKVHQNARQFEWAAEIKKRLILQAQPWLLFSDDELWKMVFGPTISRSWMVWSNGHCPSCRQPVMMYNWQVDAIKHRWKVHCPHCETFFPTNDFEAFYMSGLDNLGVFDPQQANRSLLFNLAYPDAAHPLHNFGVDDGTGYFDGQNRWRFIGAYLIYGQWKQLIVGGISRLAHAYILSADQIYAHKAAILLDRVADLYPTFDFGQQGIVYEVKGDSGYVSTWHDACEETRQLALAYDQIIDALLEDKDLVVFLSQKASTYQLENPKASVADIQTNIENRILRDALGGHRKIHSNYPRQEMTKLICETILNWDIERERIFALLDDLIAEAVVVDGVTGEKGLTDYSTIGPRGIAEVLNLFSQIDFDLLPEMFQRYPQLKQTFRFHIDTWCMGQYYPTVGDCGGFALPTRQYVGVPFSNIPELHFSMYTFFWRLYQITDDPAYVQVMYQANGSSIEELPHDLFIDDAIAFQHNVKHVINQVSTEIPVGSVNKTDWHLAILRSTSPTEFQDRRSALWLHYAAGGRHGHRDGMNLGLFAEGLDLMPDFGYPPVQYGGWGSAKARWYTMSCAHNTVIVDGKDHSVADGVTTLWVDSDCNSEGGFRAVRASGKGLIDGVQFERTVALIDISDGDVYVIDLFRVVGGRQHDKFFHSHFGQTTTQGLNLTPTYDDGNGTQMRNFQVDPAPPSYWSVDWKIDDRLGLLPLAPDLHLRYTDLTIGNANCKSEVFTAEGWVSLSGVSNDSAWIPRLMIRRRSVKSPLASTFVAVITPYQVESKVVGIRRLSLETEIGIPYPDGNVAVEVQLIDGRRDLFLSLDVENPLGLTPSLAADSIAVQQEWGKRLNAELCWVRQNRDGIVENEIIYRD